MLLALLAVVGCAEPAPAEDCEPVVCNDDLGCSRCTTADGVSALSCEDGFVAEDSNEGLLDLACHCEPGCEDASTPTTEPVTPACLAGGQWELVDTTCGGFGLEEWTANPGTGSMVVTGACEAEVSITWGRCQQIETWVIDAGVVTITGGECPAECASPMGGECGPVVGYGEVRGAGTDDVVVVGAFSSLVPTCTVGVATTWQRE